MKISNLSIRNMYGTESLDISPGKLNVLLAKNGAGKTTVFKAIQYLLTGNIRGEEFIKEGAREMSVSGNVEGNFLKRSKARGSLNKLEINGRKTTQKSFDELLESLGYLPSAVKLLTASEVISSSEPGEFTDFFVKSKLLPIEAETDKIIDLCAPLSNGARDEMLAVFAEAPRKNSLEDIDAAYKNYMDIAKEMKGRYQTIKARADKLDELEEPTFTEDQLDRELRDLERCNPSALAAYTTAIKRKAELEGQIKSLDEQIKADTSERPNPKVLENLKAEREKAAASLQENNRLAAVLAANITQSEEIITNLSKSVCPIHADIICSTDKTSVEEKLKTTLAATREERERVTSVIAELTASLSEIDKKISNYGENEKKYTAKTELLKRKKVYETSLTALTIPDKPATSSVDPSEITSKRTIIQNKRKQLAAWNEALAARKEAEEVAANLAVYKEVADKLSAKEGGIKDKIIELALEPLIETVNATAATLMVDFEMKAVASGGVRFYCRTSSASGFQRYEDISNGEKAVAEILVMDMLNQLTGTNILVLDNLDSLDEDTFEGVLALVSSPDFESRYDHIFVAAVNHSDLESIVSGMSGVTRIM